MHTLIVIILLLGCGSWFAINGMAMLYKRDEDAFIARGLIYMVLGIIMLFAGGIQAKQSYINICGTWA